MPAFAVGRIGEQESLALAFRDAAAILPAHQRMHVGIFVDRLVDDHKAAGAIKRQHVIVQIRIAALWMRFVAETGERVGQLIGALVHRGRQRDCISQDATANASASRSK